MKYPTINNFLSSDILAGCPNPMPELDSIRVREMLQTEALDVDKLSITPPISYRPRCLPVSKLRSVNRCASESYLRKNF